ncbi:MAG: hypothetical protein ACYDAA_15110 [Syntrophales bacterium]
MKGQWIGQVELDIGTVKVPALVIANIDDLGRKYAGSTFVVPNNNTLPSSVGFFDTGDKKRIATFKVYTVPVDPRTGVTSSWPQIKNMYPQISDYSTEADAELRLEKGVLHLKSKTSLGTNVEGKLFRKPFSMTSDIRGEVKSWEQYKKFVSKLLGQGNLFRGQRTPWKLRTSFHRKGRYDIYRFLNQDVRRYIDTSAQEPPMFLTSTYPTRMEHF